MSGAPRLSVSTSAGPSTPSPAPSRRPQGARRRGQPPGFIIANPDNSDDEAGSPKSLSGPGKSPVTASSSSSGRNVIAGIPPLASSGGPASPSKSSTAPLPLPTIPAPQPSPLPHVTTFPTPTPIPPLPPASVPAPPPLSKPIVPAMPPLPPPQPERHLRRAFTTPIPDLPRPSHEGRTASGSSAIPQMPSSPSRALPPLPSPPQNIAPSPKSAHSLPPLPPPSHPPPPTPSDRPHLQHLVSLTKTASPEDALTPAGASEGGRSFASAGSSESINRARSGSLAGHKRLLQVTMDNEQFTLVDITGMNTAEAIMERVFSKLRFRDDDYSTLSLYRTDIGEAADPNPLSRDQLLHLCFALGDSKATLKFLVLQTGVPGASSASVVPPVQPGEETYRSNADRRAGMTPITTDLGGVRRTPSRHSKDGSLSSTSEVFERGGLGSDWSDLGQEEEWVQRAKTGVRTVAARRLGSSASSSRSPLTGSHGTSSALPTPPTTIPTPSPTRSFGDVEVKPPSPAPPQRRGTDTPTATPSRPRTSLPNAVAGPSRMLEAGLGLQLDDDMDPETRALIEQFQREEEEARQVVEERRRQEEADAEFARKEQQSERDVWQMMQQMQLEQRRREQEQIEQDERQAREVEAEERRRLQDDQRAEEERLVRQNWENERRDRERQQSRGASFSQDRRALRNEWAQRGTNDHSAVDAWTLPTLSDGSQPATADRRPSDAQYTPTSQMFDQQIYTSPPGQYATDVPSYSNRRPLGFPIPRYEQEAHAQGQLNDPRLQEITAGLRNGGGGTQPRRGQPRHPYAYGRDDGLQTPSLLNARSMENLRPFDSQPPVSRPPFQGLPPRGSITPAPGTDRGYYRSPSVERVQDGRYPEPAHSAPSRVPPLQLALPSGNPIGQIPFPVPHSHSGTWSNYPDSRNYDDRLPISPRPSTVHYDRSPPPPSSPQTAIRRPTTLYDDHTPPLTSRTIGSDGYNHPGASYSWRPRSGSASAGYGGSSPLPESRRVSEGSSYDDTRLPYARGDDSPEQTWLAVPRSGRRDTSDTVSVAGTVSSGFSEATVRARTRSGDGEEDSADTARAGDLQESWQAMVRRGRDPSTLYLPNEILDDEEEDEATLFITAPASPKPSRFSRLRRSPSRPSLSVNTTGVIDLTGIVTPSDSATESESETRMQRHKSFARPKDGWNFRPDPEQLYDNLDALFPKIDLDKPIVDGAINSTPSTPASESPRAEYSAPPLHPTRASDPRLPQSPKFERTSLDDYHRQPPPLHPARNTVSAEIKEAKEKEKERPFNKHENRKSIRYIAQDWKRKTLLRNKDSSKDSGGGGGKDSGKEVKQEEAKPERRKSTSMWGHRLVEVTPGKLSAMQVPPTIPESPASDGKSTSITWVKGELIGKGSYGRVYIALNVNAGDMMAVKQVELPATERDRQDHRQQGMVDALQSEIALLKDLYHPNIVQYLGCETSAEYLSIFLEYVPGGTIASIYRTPNQAPFEEQLVKFFTEQILEGLAYLHAKHIWHRDLKGDNILVDAMGVCKISDFGISKQTADAYDSFGQATNMKGSVFWMAPEVIHSASERTYSGKVDIWSLGCVVLEMWTGKRPWGDMEQVAAMFELFNKRARPPLPPDIHLSEIALDFLNTRCLATDPRDRPMARELLQHPFIRNIDAKWTFANSKIGKAVAKRAPKKIVAAGGTGTPTLTPPPGVGGM